MTTIVPVVVVHGGAGAVPLPKRPVHAEGCKRAAELALDAIAAGADALEAALRAVEALENDPLFNAGTGACLNEDGELELDASVMHGRDLSLGGVAGIGPYRNPIRVADAVRLDGRHVLYAAGGAERFAVEAGFERSPEGSMITDAAKERLARVLDGAEHERHWAGSTVGAVVCDAAGDVAAATSTGGTVAKRAGRVGDTPIAGAGSWADNSSGACSTTGVGEHILRFGLARHAADLLRSGIPAQSAADASIAAFGARVAGRGGLILVDARGGVGVARNTETMSYAIARAGEGARFGF